MEARSGQQIGWVEMHQVSIPHSDPFPLLLAKQTWEVAKPVRAQKGEIERTDETQT